MSSPSVTSAEILDVDGCLTRFGGDRGLLLEMTAMLLEDVPSLSRDLRSAVERGDSLAIAAKAHALKGLVANCGGVRAAAAAQLLEDAGHLNRLGDVPTLAESLEQELSHLIAAIREFHSGMPSG
jgi:HPt (histidine-containing phosphotransfer) domain-containing protein